MQSACTHALQSDDKPFCDALAIFGFTVNPVIATRIDEKMVEKAPNAITRGRRALPLWRIPADMQLWRKLIPLMAGLALLACQAPAPNVNTLPASAPTGEALVVQGNTARENRDYTEAMRLYRQAADMGNATAMNNIGQLYQSGSGVPSDYGE